MNSSTARALYKFADAVVFLEHVRDIESSLVSPDELRKDEARKILSDALSNLKFAKKSLFEALEREDLT